MKKTHEEAKYRPANSTVIRCGTCSMFRHTSPHLSCTLVQSPVRPAGMCDYYEPKTGKEAAQPVEERKRA